LETRGYSRLDEKINPSKERLASARLWHARPHLPAFSG
jgi:hypothetical protein